MESKCSYCYSTRPSSRFPKITACQCKICLNCLEFLINQNHFFCPFCEASFSKSDLISRILPSKQGSQSFSNSPEEVLFSIKSKLKEIKISSEKYLKKIQIYNITCKLLKNQENLSKFYEFPYLNHQNQKLVKDLNIFKA